MKTQKLQQNCLLVHAHTHKTLLSRNEMAKLKLLSKWMIKIELWACGWVTNIINDGVILFSNGIGDVFVTCFILMTLV